MASRLNLLIWVIFALIQFSAGQIEYDPDTNSLVCSKLNGSYCLSGSLEGSTMVSCVSTNVAEIRSCNIQLSPILPHQYKDNAACWEPSPESGNAVCAFNGTGYSPNGTVARVPETVLCDSVNPSVEQQQQQQQGSPSSIYEDMVKRVSNVFSEGVARIPRLHPTSADSDSHADDVSMDPTVPRQETIHCSNPAGEKQSKLYQNTVSGAPEFSQATSLVPVCDSSPATHTPFLQALNMAPVSTSGTDTLSGVRPVVTKTEIITVTANASTTTVMSTSTVARMKSGPTSFSIGDESKAGVSSVVFLVMMVFWIVVAYLNV